MNRRGDWISHPKLTDQGLIDFCRHNISLLISMQAIYPMIVTNNRKLCFRSIYIFIKQKISQVLHHRRNEQVPGSTGFLFGERIVFEKKSIALYKKCHFDMFWGKMNKFFRFDMKTVLVESYWQGQPCDKL
jgi:hypothetical protein